MSGSLLIKDMKVIYLPDHLTVINDEAFSGGDFEAVIIPDGCKEIGHLAFAYCDNLRYILIPSSVTTVASDAFLDSIHVIEDRK